MRLTAPDRNQLKESGTDVKWTVGAGENDIKFTNDELDELKWAVRRKDGNGETERLFRFDVSGNEIENFRLDFSLLKKILYEHRRYSDAQGFSEAEMDILRAIEFHSEKRVGIDEIMEHEQVKEYSEPTIYRHLRSLLEKDLIRKVRPGLYQYNGI